MASFVPRAAFPVLDSLPKSYFIGHHKSALDSIRRIVSSIDLVIECRDYRVPLTSINPLFEQSLEGRKRVVVYTKRDVGAGHLPEDSIREKLLTETYAPTPVMFTNAKNKYYGAKVLKLLRQHLSSAQSLTGLQVLVVGMPNVGKSSLLNSLRWVGMDKRKKASKTGDQPGVTRKILSAVKIARGAGDGNAETGIYLKDSPGVFVPYIPDPEAMLKLALVGCVKDTIISPVTAADYCLYQINKNGFHNIYKKYHPPTNDIMGLLIAMGKKTGQLKGGGEANIEAVALKLLQQFRNGQWGRFCLDDVTPETIQMCHEAKPFVTSYTAAKKEFKALRLKGESEP